MPGTKGASLPSFLAWPREAWWPMSKLSTFHLLTDVPTGRVVTLSVFYHNSQASGTFWAYGFGAWGLDVWYTCSRNFLSPRIPPGTHTSFLGVKASIWNSDSDMGKVPESQVQLLGFVNTVCLSLFIWEPHPGQGSSPNRAKLRMQVVVKSVFPIQPVLCLDFLVWTTEEAK